MAPRKKLGSEREGGAMRRKRGAPGRNKKEYVLLWDLKIFDRDSGPTQIFLNSVALISGPEKEASAQTLPRESSEL